MGARIQLMPRNIAREVKEQELKTADEVCIMGSPFIDFSDLKTQSE